MIEIVYPEQRVMSEAEVEQRYIDVLVQGLIFQPHHSMARTPAEMAEVLHDLGIIRLQCKQPL